MDRLVLTASAFYGTTTSSLDSHELTKPCCEFAVTPQKIASSIQWLCSDVSDQKVPTGDKGQLQHFKYEPGKTCAH